MSQFLTQILLPISLAFIMLGIGLSVKVNDFTALKGQKTAIIAGFILQVIALPVLAFILISLFDVKGEYALALLLVAACPGGVTSNAITFIFSGVVALSVVLTLLSGLLAPFTIPLITQWGLQHYLGDAAAREFSLATTIVKLFILSIVPLALGQLIQRLAPMWTEKNSERVRKFSGRWFLALIIAMIVTNFALLLKVVADIGWFIFVLSVASLMLGYWGARLLKLPYDYRLTLAVEVGVQNAGIGIFVAAAVLHNEPMKMLLIAYGILMQVPIFTFAWWYRNRYLKELTHAKHA